MADYSEVDAVALTLVQATALLLPVVFLSFRFYLDDAEGNTPAKEIEESAKRLVLMIFLLTATGFLSTIAILDFSLKPTFAFFAVLTLATFFLLYGWFFYKIAT
ncbi:MULTISPECIES: hypothetical protein [unclassified Halorubrum]|uniref:hypothetical protein n=1 Tax=unclassified Halorubrum TaxID=2642239 RepID=UPI00113FD562|nr:MULTISPECIES: hypothetical protein [unclassified Halorubrum]